MGGDGPGPEHSGRRRFSGANALAAIDRVPGSTVVRDDRTPLGTARLEMTSHDSEVAPSEFATLAVMLRPKGTLQADFGGQRFVRRLSGTTMMFTPPGVERVCEFDGATSNTVVTLGANAFGTLESLGGTGGGLEPRVGRWRNPKLERLVLEAHGCMTARPVGWRLEAEAFSMLIALELVRDFGARAEAVSEKMLGANDLDRAVDFIEAHLSENFDLSTLAGAVGREVFAFAKSFKAETGLSPHQFVIERRVERAQEMLARTSCPIGDIALACGFSSQAHMTSTFSRRLGVSPGVYRKAAAADP